MHVRQIALELQRRDAHNHGVTAEYSAGADPCLGYDPDAFVAESLSSSFSRNPA